MTSLYIGANQIGPGSEDQSDCSKFQNDPTLALRGQNDPTLVISLLYKYKIKTILRFSDKGDVPYHRPSIGSG